MNFGQQDKTAERVTSGEDAIEMPELKEKKAKEFLVCVNRSNYSLSDINQKLCIYFWLYSCAKNKRRVAPEVRSAGMDTNIEFRSKKKFRDAMSLSGLQALESGFQLLDSCCGDLYVVLGFAAAEGRD
jgi:hypothetical protein